jgi:signal transduction histidine kinase
LQARRLRDCLEKAGYRVSVATNGREGLNTAKAHRPSLVISDIVMPVMDGFVMCRAMRNDGLLKNIPIIILTSLSNPEDIVKGLEAGADSYVSKPYEAKILLSRIRAVMSLPRLEQEGTERKLQVVLGGKRYIIAANRLQVLSLLLSTYEDAVLQNLRLREARRNLVVLNEKLERMVATRTAALEDEVVERKQAETALAQQARELARSNAELAQFAYVVSHDLKEPLRMVASYTQLLAKRYGGKLDADADDFINFAVDGVNRMQSLISALLVYSRVGTEGGELKPADCEKVLATTLANLQSAIEDSGAVVMHKQLPHVRCDETQLGQLFQNLIGNAIKFRGDLPPRVEITAERGKGAWLFSVRDNGIGIASEHLERIFVIFQRLHGRSDYPGTGIGLAICQKIVERHGGKIWVESKPGAGSKFSFTIPYGT